MAILKTTPPNAVIPAFQRDVRSYLRWEDGDRENKPFENYVGQPSQIPSFTDIFGPTDGREVVYEAMPVYVMATNDLARKPGVCTAVQSGWRIFVGNAQRKVVMGRVSLKKGEAWKLTGVYYGDRVWAWIDERRQLDGMEAVQKDDYDLRLLTIPGLSEEAFWLKSRSHCEDLVVPLRWPDTSKSKPDPETMAHFLARMRMRKCGLQTAHAHKD